MLQVVTEGYRWLQGLHLVRGGLQRVKTEGDTTHSYRVVTM